MNIANVLERKGITYRLIHPLTLASKRRIHRQSSDYDDLKDSRLILKLGLEGEFTKTQLEHRLQYNIMEFLASEHQDVQELVVNEKKGSLFSVPDPARSLAKARNAYFAISPHQGQENFAILYLLGVHFS